MNKVRKNLKVDKEPKSKKSKKKQITAEEKAKKKAEGLAEKCRSTKCQVIILAMSFAWTLIVILMTFNLKKKVDGLEAQALATKPWEFINATFFYAIRDLKTNEFKEKRMVHLLERISRLARNESLSAYIENATIKHNAVNEFLDILGVLSQSCESYSRTKINALVLNATAEIVNAAKGNLPFCEPRKAIKALVQCPDVSTIQNGMGLINAFINWNNDKCREKSIVALSKFNKENNNIELSDIILEFLVQKSNSAKDIEKSEVCSMVTEIMANHKQLGKNSNSFLCDLIQKMSCKDIDISVLECTNVNVKEYTNNDL